MRVFVCLLFFISVLSGQPRIAEITAPIETAFGTYQPHCSDVVPDCAPLDVGEDLEKVVNLDQFSFSRQELVFLKQNHFIVTPAKRRAEKSGPNAFNEIYDIYNYCRENGIPVFVTSDAMLHTFHLCFDHILKTCEERRFFRYLNELLDAMLQETVAQVQTASDPEITVAIERNLHYLIVAKKLLYPSFSEPINGGLYLDELQLINDYSLPVTSPLFGYTEDYSQYKPRGHYTRSDSLKQYFKSMMWLGRMTFACGDTSDVTTRSMTLSAIYLTQLIDKLKINSMTALEVWQRIYNPTVLFVGKSDDIDILTYLELAGSVYGNDFDQLSLQQLAEPQKLDQFLSLTLDLEAARITYPGQPARGFRLMGQRFIPDSWILDELVFNKIPNRFMPTGLDVMYVLGSDRAFEYLPQQDRDNPYYVDKADSLRQIFFSYPPSAWVQNAYWNWLYCWIPLLTPKGEGYPYFMQTSAWIDKDLYAVLASWAELRHDTILYAKQSGTEVSIPPSAVVQQGYVEPDPVLFGRMAALVDFLGKGLDQYDLLFSEFDLTLNTFYSYLLRLKSIAEKELTNAPLDAEDYERIFNAGKTIYSIATFGKGDVSSIANDSDQEPMPIVADVHTDANTNTVLEQAVGYPCDIYVICRIEGEAKLTRGAVFSYYEFTRSLQDGRLTDEEWRQLLQASPPQKPEWISSFLVESGASAVQPGFFRVSKPWATRPGIEILPQQPRVGDTLEIKITFDTYGDVELSAVELETVSGQCLAADVSVVSNAYNGEWKATVATESLPGGQVYVNIEGSISKVPLYYRTFFQLGERLTGVDKQEKLPDTFRLYQNHPNPFNPKTSIQFDLSACAFVELDILDLRGRVVCRLLCESMPPGQHEATWDGTATQGHRSSSGVYFYRLSVNGSSYSKRMILLK